MWTTKNKGKGNPVKKKKFLQERKQLAACVFPA
jgi:hypothetical protein